TKYTPKLKPMFKIKTVEKSRSSASLVRIKEDERPLSVIEVPIAIKTAIIPTNPNSSGPSQRAKITVVMKESPFKTNVSTTVHTTPPRALFRNDIYKEKRFLIYS